MNILEFANPSGWWWAALAIPIVVLYILKIRQRRQPVATLLFWDQLFDEKKPRAWWQRLRHWLSLLLQLAFLALVVAALTDPLWSWQKNQQRRTVLIVDNSASMRAVEADGRSRLQKAKQSAAALIRSMRSGDRMAILSASGRTEVVLGMTDHQRSLLAAIDQLPQTDGPTDVLTAVTAAERLLSTEQKAGETPTGEIAVVSDGCIDKIDELQSNQRVRLFGVGSPRDNLAITRYQVRRSLIDVVGYQVLIDVTNFSTAERSCRVELNLDDQLVDVLPFELPPGATETRFLDHTSAAGGKLVATLNESDALPTDNRAVAVLPKRTAVPVLLVTQGNLFLKGVLEAIPLVDLQIASEAPSVAPAGGILVLDRIVPEKLPVGKVIVVDPQGSCDAWMVGEPIAQPMVAAVEADSRLTQHVRLDNVMFPAARQMTFSSPAEALIRDALDQPLLARLPRADGDAVVLTCSLEQGDLPLRIAFPVLMKNTVEWFQGQSGELRPTVATGKMLMVDVATQGSADQHAGKTAPLAAATQETDVALVEQAALTVEQPLELVSPSGQVAPLTALDQQVTIGPLLETGLWTIRPAAKNGGSSKMQPVAAGQPNSSSSGTQPNKDQVVQVACNLVDSSESDLRPRAKLADFDGQGLLALGGQSMWYYLTCLAALLIAAEWWLYQRRIVG